MFTFLPKPLRLALGWALILGAAWLFLRFLLPFFLPLVLAFALAAVCEGAVRWLVKLTRLPRAACAGACIAAALGIFSAAAWLLLSRLYAEVRDFAVRLPRILEQLVSSLAELRAAAEALFGLSEGTPWLDRIWSAVADVLLSLPGKVSAMVLSAFSSAASRAPGALLFAVTAIIGAYFVSASYPELKAFFALQLSEKSRARLCELKSGLRTTVWRWLRAQLIMMLIVFACMALAFLLLGVDYALLLALLTALVDALPVFGTGTVLIPWAAYELLAGEPGLGIGLLLSYAAVTVLRSCIQAKLLGDQLGLHPLASLAAIYIGWRVCGVWGMIAFPILAISLVRMNASGIINLWKTPEKNEGGQHGRGYIQYNSRGGNERSGGDEYPSR